MRRMGGRWRRSSGEQGRRALGRGDGGARGVPPVRSSGSSGWDVSSEPGSGAPGRGFGRSEAVWHVMVGTGYLCMT